MTRTIIVHSVVKFVQLMTAVPVVIKNRVAQQFWRTLVTEALSSCVHTANSLQDCYEIEMRSQFTQRKCRMRVKGRSHNVQIRESVHMSLLSMSSIKTAFHDTDTDILAMILARMSVSMSVSWNAVFTADARVSPSSVNGSLRDRRSSK